MAHRDPKALAAALVEPLKSTGTTEMERRVWGVAIEAGRAGVEALAGVPLEIDIDWPAGVPADARVTLRAQLEDQLQRLAVRRVSVEFRVLLSLAPAALAGVVGVADQVGPSLQKAAEIAARARRKPQAKRWPWGRR